MQMTPINNYASRYYHCDKQKVLISIISIIDIVLLFENCIAFNNAKHNKV